MLTPLGKYLKMEVTIRTHRWNWIGYTLRRANSNITKPAIENNGSTEVQIPPSV
jgi:hypothetical protein